jgi:hypothetical protein
MLVDPWIDQSVAFQTSDTAGTLYALEVCDVCEADDYSYEINGIAVSDFVTPAWFEGWRAPNSTRFDHMQRIEKPLSLLPGGYIGIMRFSGGGWTQITEAHPSGMTSQFRPHVGAQGTPALAAGLVASLDRSPGRPPLIGVVFRRPDTLLPRCCP